MVFSRSKIFVVRFCRSEGFVAEELCRGEFYLGGFVIGVFVLRGFVVNGFVVAIGSVVGNCVTRDTGLCSCWGFILFLGVCMQCSPRRSETETLICSQRRSSLSLWSMWSSGYDQVPEDCRPWLYPVLRHARTICLCDLIGTRTVRRL